DVVNWYSEGSGGGLPSGVLIIIILIVLAPLLGAIASYLLSIWLLRSSRRCISTKIVTILIMIATVLFVESQMVYYNDIVNPRFDFHFSSVVVASHSNEWLLDALIILSLSMFCLQFRRLNQNRSDFCLRKMDLLLSAAVS